MNTYPECIPCFLKQALLVSEKLNLKDKDKKEFLMEVSKLSSQGIDLRTPPPYIARKVYDLAFKYSPEVDLFKKEKDLSTKKALSFYPLLKERIIGSSDPLQEAVRISIMGNIIDYGVSFDFKLDREIEKIDEKFFAVFDYERFRSDLNTAKWILYIGDNAGECVFDKLLIETINKKTFYAVRSRPIINDALISDAFGAGLETVSEIVDSGSKIPGVSLKDTSLKFKRLFSEAPAVISKGQGNFETLSDVKRDIFFLLQAKCLLVAEMFSCKIGDFVLSLNAKNKKQAN